MKIVNGNEVPETIEDARKMTYYDLQKACEYFNNHGISAQDIQKQWDNHWWKGFDAAIELVIKTVEESGFFDNAAIANQFNEELIDEVEIYKKDK